MEEYEQSEFMKNMLPVQELAHAGLLAQLDYMNSLTEALKEDEFLVDTRYEKSPRTNSQELMHVVAIDVSKNAGFRRDRVKVEMEPYFNQFNVYVSGAEGPRRDAVLELIKKHNLKAILE